MKIIIFLFLLLLTGCDYSYVMESEVIFLHGFGYFPSNGMTNLSEKLKKEGIKSISGSRFIYFENAKKAQILAGHSMGADECLLIARANPHIHYDLVILVDPFNPIDRPKNIGRIVLIRGWSLGGNVQADESYHFDVGHILLDDDERVHEIIRNEILNYFRWKKTQEIIGETDANQGITS